MAKQMTRTETAYSYEHCDECETTVQGVRYLVWGDQMLRGMRAQDTVTGEVRVIRRGGYISADLTARKAIAAAFGLDSFRK